MLPTRAVLVPVFERFLQMKLNAVDQLALGAFDHHLVFGEIGSRQQLEIIGYPVELKAVILPHAQDPSFFCVFLPDARLRIIDAAKDRAAESFDVLYLFTATK